jgi:hypothetical protein
LPATHHPAGLRSAPIGSYRRWRKQHPANDRSEFHPQFISDKDQQRSPRQRLDVQNARSGSR